MPRGRKKGTVVKVAGRKKGTPNKRTVVMKTVEQLIKSHGIDPLEFVFRQIKLPMPKSLKTTHQEKMQVHQFRQKAAEVALPYTRPKLAQTLNLGPGPGGANINYNENLNTEQLNPDDPGFLEGVRRIAFAMRLGVQEAERQRQLKEKVINPGEPRRRQSATRG